MKKIHQFVFRDSSEVPIDENIIEDFAPVIQLGIQGLPGNKFSINNGGSITLSNLGIFEISDVEIISLAFSNVIINNTNDSTFQSTPLIIDIVYDKEG